MRRYHDPIDWLIAKAFGPLIARWHRRKVERLQASGLLSMGEEFERTFPDHCAYCSYTRWVNTEHGQSLKVEPHRCREGKSPPCPLPRATVRRFPK